MSWHPGNRHATPMAASLTHEDWRRGVRPLATENKFNKEARKIAMQSLASQTSEANFIGRPFATLPTQPYLIPRTASSPLLRTPSQLRAPPSQPKPFDQFTEPFSTLELTSRAGRSSIVMRPLVTNVAEGSHIFSQYAHIGSNTTSHPALPVLGSATPHGFCDRPPRLPSYR